MYLSQSWPSFTYTPVATHFSRLHLSWFATLLAAYHISPPPLLTWISPPIIFTLTLILTSVVYLLLDCHHSHVLLSSTHLFFYLPLPTHLFPTSVCVQPEFLTSTDWSNCNRLRKLCCTIYCWTIYSSFSQARMKLCSPQKIWFITTQILKNTVESLSMNTLRLQIDAFYYYCICLLHNLPTYYKLSS